MLFDKENKKLSEKQSVTTNNNIRNKITNSLNLNQDHLLKKGIVDSYTLQHYEQGGAGQAKWAIENILTDVNSGNKLYICSDKNRKIFIYQDTDGNIITDIKANKLRVIISSLLESKIKEFKKIKYTELGTIDNDDNSLLEKCNQLYAENKELSGKFFDVLVEETYV